jgi:hypothetical protein
MSNRIFRKVALERLASPEQLDQMMLVTSPKGWLALLGVGGLLLVAIIWGVFGTIPTTVPGEGILIRGDGVKLIDSALSGRVTKIVVNVGDLVEAGQAVATIETDDNDTELVYSTQSGRVLEIRVNEGSYITQGTTLMSLEEYDKDLEAILYLTPISGQRVSPGMEVQISLSTVRPEEFGALLGTVESVSGFPATAQGMLRVLGSEDLVRSMSANGAPVEVRIKLNTASTFSGYEWSFPAGPPILIQGGTVCKAMIILGEQHPISLVFGGN